MKFFLLVFCLVGNVSDGHHYVGVSFLLLCPIVVEL